MAGIFEGKLSGLHEKFDDYFTFFANSVLPNFPDISVCNKSDLIMAFDNSARATRCARD